MTEAERLAERLMATKGDKFTYTTNRTAPPISTITQTFINPDGPEAAALIRSQAEELERLRALIGVWEKNYANQERLPPEFETAIYSNLEGLYEDSAPPKAAPEQEPSGA